MLSKNKTIFIAILGSIIFAASLFASKLGLCLLVNSSCTEFFDPIAELFIPFVSLLLFSLLTYNMRDEVYRAWFWFARWWVPLSMFLILISPEYTNDLIIPIVKGTVALATSVIFALISLISLIVIAWTYLKMRRKG